MAQKVGFTIHFQTNPLHDTASVLFVISLCSRLRVIPYRHWKQKQELTASKEAGKMAAVAALQSSMTCLSLSSNSFLGQRFSPITLCPVPVCYCISSETFPKFDSPQFSLLFRWKFNFVLKIVFFSSFFGDGILALWAIVFVGAWV